MAKMPNEEELFAMYLRVDRTFWGDLFRQRGARTFDDARRIAGQLKAEVAAEREAPKKPDFSAITRSFC